MSRVLFFTGQWCAKCHHLKNQLADIDYIEYFDVEENQEYCNSLEVRSLPTLIFLDDEGNETAKLVGPSETAVRGLLW
jgi:hypothetical protein